VVASGVQLARRDVVTEVVAQPLGRHRGLLRGIDLSFEQLQVRESVLSLDAGLDLVVGQAGLFKQRATDFVRGKT
jgi:hypothetical protein